MLNPTDGQPDAAEPERQPRTGAPVDSPPKQASPGRGSGLGPEQTAAPAPEGGDRELLLALSSEHSQMKAVILEMKRKLELLEAEKQLRGAPSSSLLQSEPPREGYQLVRAEEDHLAFEGSLAHPGDPPEQKRETVLFAREDRATRGFGAQREERPAGDAGFVFEGSLRNANPHLEHKRETMLYGSRGERERGQPQTDEQAFVLEGSLARPEAPEDHRRETMLYREGARRVEPAERARGGPVRDAGSPQREAAPSERLQEDQRERMRRRREQLDKLHASPSNAFTSPVSIDRDRFKAVADRALSRSRGFDLGLSFTDEKEKPSRSAVKQSPTAEPFFGQYKELRLQRYEKFHTKLQELMKELSVEERTRLLPDRREESQEAELKREWKFVKDLVQTLVKANKRIRELERQEKATTAQFDYDRRRLGTR